MALTKLLFIFLYCFLSVSALGLTDGKVIVDDLNVRKSPGGELVGKLTKSQRLQIVNEESGWSQIVYAPEGSEKTLHGWVASEYIQPEFKISSTDCTPDPLQGVNHCLSTTKPDLQCEIVEQTSNFSACSVDIGYELSRDHGNLSDLEVHCVVNMRTRNTFTSEWENWFQMSNVQLENVSEATAAGSIELRFDFGEESNVKYFRLAETDCKVIFDNSADQTAQIPM